MIITDTCDNSEAVGEWKARWRSADVDVRVLDNAAAPVLGECAQGYTDTRLLD